MDRSNARFIPFVAVAATALLLAAPVSGADPLPEPQSKGDIVFLSGGVGDAEQDALREVMDRYKLAVTMSRPGDEAYLANVHLTLRNAAGKEVLETTTRGPVFLANLPAGRYTLRATLAEHAPEQRVVDVPEEGQVRMYVTLPEKSS